MMHAAVQPDPDASADQTAEVTHFAHQRAAIDMIATLRARMVRCALFATNILRAHPIASESDADRQRWHDKFAEQYEGIKRSFGLLNGQDVAGAVPQDVCDWIARSVAAQPKQLEVMHHMLTLTDAMHTALTGTQEDLDSAMKAHFEFGHVTFYNTVTEICDGLWSQLDAQRAGDLLRVQQSGHGLGNILERLERIGKHVRLVSLNASVEAARVGDAGKGLGVIAVEFKSLAEEIQHLSATARENINGITGRSP